MKSEWGCGKYWVLVTWILFLMLSVSCNGGGQRDVDNGNGNGDDGTGGLTVTDYSFALDLDIEGTGVIPFQLAAEVEEGTEVSVPFAGMPGNLLGSDYNGILSLGEQNNEIFISSITVDDTTVFNVDVSDIWENTHLQITVVDPIVYTGGDDPSDGAFTMENGTEDPVTVSFYKDGENYMVTISDMPDPVELDALKGYLETSMDTLSQQLSVAYHMIELLYDQVTFVAATIVKIEDDDLGTVHGDPQVDLPDPTGGTFTLTCISGPVVPGADFSAVFQNFWLDEPDEDIDTLIDGSLDLQNYLRIELNDVLTDLGFAWSNGAGVFYSENGVAFYETEEVGGVLTQNWTHTIFGSYSIVFTAQQ
jgi:hypothetical protein